MKNKILRRLTSVSIAHMSSNSSLSPLQGIRVLDLSRILAGPFATMILGDLGAEIIKIERPGRGDDTRDWGPPFLEKDSRESAYFLSVNRNKKSACININSSEGQGIIQKLATSCDVLVENYVPGKLKEKGLDYETLHKISPSLIYCSITGFGPDGPYEKRGGYDVIAASMGGLMHVTGEKEGGPMKVGVAMTDICTGLYAYGAIMAALIHRSKHGKGQKIDCNLLSTQVSAMTHLANNYLNAGIIPERWGTGHASIVPYQTFQTSDGYLTIGCGNNKQFKELCTILHLEDLKKDPRYLTNEARVQHRDQLINTLSAILRSKTTQYWCGKMDGASFPFGPVNNMRDVFDDPQVIHNNLHQRVHHSSLGEISQVGPAVLFSESENKIRHPPPTLGQHTEQVLSELLNMSENEIRHLRSKMIIN